MLQLSASARHSVQRQCRTVSKLSGLQKTQAQYPKHALSIGDISRVGQSIASRDISSSSAKQAHEAAMPESRLNAFIPPFMLNGNAQPKNEAEADEFWRKIPIWKDVPAEQFMSWSWGMRNDVQFHKKSDPLMFRSFIGQIVPDFIPLDKVSGRMQSRDEFIDDIFAGFACSAMSVRMTPYIFSRINWTDPRNDPIFRQFMPLGSMMLPDHPMCDYDSLHEKSDSKVTGLVHRYPDKALFLATNICPTYCSYCTRSYDIGADTETLEKKGLFKQRRAQWDACLDHIASTPEIQDVVVSGGDSFFIGPQHLIEIGQRLINMPNIKKFRFASKGLAVSPNRFLDPNDQWANALIHVSQQAEKAGKRMALHTHFNHPNEISWVTEKACRRLREAGVTVRNQTVLLRGINDDVKTMGTLIRTLSDTLRVQPYYVYQCDMVPKAEHFRTPLQTILDMEKQLMGSIAGFDLPKFIVDLPGGGGKQPAHSKLSYDRSTGISTYDAPAVKGGNKIYEYHDPVDSLVGSH
ncbi:hypothetical protein KJ359_005755 [Pestalotiopsis sp. 9143b]|nr:hypothetical protein KJ359_005755 [Pestalotiopsis sp. 9143b]